MKYNDYTARYTYESFTKLTVSEKCALLAIAVNKNGFGNDRFTDLSRRSPVLAMQYVFNDEKKMGMPNANYYSFSEWLNFEAQSFTENERWSMTPAQLKSLEEYNEHEFQRGREAYKAV